MKSRTTRPQHARSLTTTLAIAFITLSVVSLVIDGGVALYRNLKVYQESIAVQQLLAAADASDVVRSFIQEKFNTLETAVDFANPVKASPTGRETFIDGLLGSHPSFQEFMLLNKQGVSLADTSGLRGAPSQQFVSYHEDALSETSAGNNYISPVYIDKGTNEPLLTIAIPVKDVFGDIEGSLMAEVNLKFMWSLVDQIEVGETGYVYVVDHQGNLIAFQDTSRVLAGENASQISEVNEFIENPSESADIKPEVASYTGLTGTTVLGTYVPLGTPNWAVVIEQPTTEAYAAVYQSVVVSIATILLMALLAGIAGVIIARRLALPLIDLTGTATRIADGHIQLQATASGAREIVTLATAFNKMTSQLRDLISSLEQRVEDRTKALTSVAEVTTAASTILETDKLLQRVVDLTKDRFGFYHAHIYLFNETRDALVLSSGVGEVGRQMVAEMRSIPLNSEQSLVARAAREKKGVTVNDVTTAPDFLPNPLLPDTHSELAVPMMVADTVIGVFDVQSEVVGRFTDADIAVQTTLAAQVASAVQNARQYTKTQALVHELGETESFLDSVIENLPTMLFVKNAGDLRFMRWNKAAEELSGFPREDLIGKNDYDFFPKEEADLFTGNDRQVLANGQLLDIPEEPLATAHQGMRYLHTRKVPIYGADGIVKYLLGISEDITERKRTEELTLRRADQQEAINQITQKIQSATTIEEAMQVAARELGHALGKRQTLVALEPSLLGGNAKSIIDE